MLQMMRTLKMPRDMRSSHLMPSTMPLRQMAIYTVQLNQDRSAEQAHMPIVLPFHTPCTWGPIIIKAKLGMEDQLRDDDTTMDEYGENEHSRSDTTKGQSTSSPKLSRGNTKRSRTDHTWVPKKAEVVMLTELREVSCDRCWMKVKNVCHESREGKHWMHVWDVLERNCCVRQVAWADSKGCQGKRCQGARGKWYGECWAWEVVDEGI